MKQCKHCKEEFPNTSEHFAIRKKNKDGLSGVCKICLRKQQRDHYHRTTKEGTNYHTKKTNKRRAEQGLPPLSRKTAKEGYKICTVCEEELLATNEFFHNAKYSKDGLFSKCKECRNKENRERAAIERKKNKDMKLINSNTIDEKYLSQRKKMEIERQNKEEETNKKYEEIYQRLISIPHNEALQLNKVKVTKGKCYQIKKAMAGSNRKKTLKLYFEGELIQETKVHITLRNKVGRCETFLKADLLLREYEIKEAI